ncbi:MAG: LPS-assembly protein LptD [Prevotella sp.]|nr:LPS-assembly protein LptD [Prevotella sp.]
MKRKSAIVLMLFVMMMMMAEMPMSFISSARQSSEDNDSVPVDTILKPGIEASAKMKRDTSTMDSIELAIYKHNKAVDDSLARDSINRKRKNGIDSPVEYTANDSLTYDAASGLAHLYGESHVKYQNMDLQSDQISMCLDSNLVHATGSVDTATNQLIGTPIFKMGNDEYESDTMAFNFKSKKGLISGVYTKQEDGYLSSELSKRGDNGEMYLQHGRYTTCDDPHPDFYLALSRAKVRPGKDVVFGPAYLVVADVPLPLAVPYGFFPFTKSYSSGLIMPTYGDETEKGFYLRDGGYYFAINDKIDLKLIGEIYTKGSWGLSANSNYNKRYRYSGTFYASYQSSVRGEKNMPDYAKETSFKVQWSHRQDAKANPFTTLQASVNFATSGYEKNNLSSMYNPQALTQTTRTSSVSWTTNFSSLGMSINGSTRLNQNMRDSIIELTLPDLTINVSRFYPFKRKKRVGPERWYEKINMSYTGHMKNEISTKEDKLLHSSLSKDWKNGMDHAIPISASFTAFNYLNLSPSINLRDVTTFKKVERSWDAKNQREVRDTTTGFYNLYSWNVSMNANTKLYGFWVPNRKIFGDKIQAIRHVLTPEIGFTYAPDFGSAKYGYWKQYLKTDESGNETMVDYSPYDGAAYSVPSKGKTGMITFGLGNNLEMKVKSDDDSTGFKKISLIDEFKLSTYYNLAAEKRPMGDVSATLRLKLSKSYTFNMSTSFASYQYEIDSLGNIVESEHTTYWQKGKIGRFQGFTQSLNYNLSNEKVMNFIKWLKGEKVEKKKDNKKKPTNDDDWSTETNIDKEMEEAKHSAKGKKGDKAETDEDGYMTFKLPWSLRLSYSINMREDKRKEKFNYEKMRYPYKFTHNLNASGNIRISDGWDISYASGYDFENKKIAMTTVGLSRDLHCFNMSCQVVLAPYTSYNFSFRCNASTLTDALKYDKRSSQSNAVQWY